MGNSQRYVRVAVNGPVRKSFIYHLSDPSVCLHPGQRLLVPFGRSRLPGFYLGEADKPAGFETRPIIETIDAESFFPAELFKLCTWMADYYFANPADCLSAALPGLFKSRRAIQYRWTGDNIAKQSSVVNQLIKPGKRLRPVDIRELRAKGGGLLEELIRTTVIIEEYGSDDSRTGKTLSGYATANRESWEDFFGSRKFRPSPFDGTQSKAELTAEGWTEHFIKLSLKQGLLVPVYEERAGGIFEFVSARDDVIDLKLTEEQQVVTVSVANRLGNGFKVFLLHGVTGSGKTLVYCHLARQVLERGQTVLVLTPEISLSGTALAYFRGFFGQTVTILHSAMTERERLESWKGIRTGRFRIVVGPRSAVFAPLDNLGLVIVDEEHDGSYKQDDPAPRFHGRDTAIMRARISNVPVLLGSASPSIESYHNARTGRYKLLHIGRRPGKASLPAVQVVDMKSQQIKGGLAFLSFPLKKKIDSCLQRGEQAILFLNRRGHSPQLKCAECGHVPKCPHCQVNLTYHKAGSKLSCHYCGFLRFNYDVCESCQSIRVLYLGAGTQKVEEEIPRLFSGATVARFDSDTASGRKNAYRILRDFSDGKYNLLLGTQMVTKGLDFSGVSLVGVLSADQGLDLPDFRATEKTFARLLQVAGRSGRTSSGGEVLIQTFYPEEQVIDDAARQDYVSFFEHEVESRRKGWYPPFCRLVNIVVSGPDERKVEQEAQIFAERLRQAAQEYGISMTLLGPAPCPFYFLRKQFRRHLLVKTKQTVKLVGMLTSWEASQARFGLSSSVKLVIDVDPDDMM
jgi:primosomal protein N' (replication factor Y)